MPSYELTVLLRKMPRNELVNTLRRTADAIFEKGGIIKRMDNLGFKQTPFRVSAHDLHHREAHYFILAFDVRPSAVSELHDYYARDVDIIRRRIFKTLSPLEVPLPEPECTLEEDLKPPAYRKRVQKMIEIEKRSAKPKFKFNLGIDYYPFQR